MSEDGGNGKLESKPEITPEQLASERFTRYQEDPESFIEISELICAVIRNPKSQLGVSVMVGNARRSEISIAQSELNYRIDFVRRQMDIQSEIEHKNKITPVKSSFLNGVRNLGRK
jgi:hypothetical protein